MKPVADKEGRKAVRETIRIAIPGDRGIASEETIRKADRQRRFEAALTDLFTNHRELLRRLAE